MSAKGGNWTHVLERQQDKPEQRGDGTDARRRLGLGPLGHLRVSAKPLRVKVPATHMEDGQKGGTGGPVGSLALGFPQTGRG